MRLVDTVGTPARSWSNWAGTAHCRPARIARPTGEEHVAELVGRAAAAGRRVRCAGTGHSFNRLATTEGLLLDMRGLRGARLVDGGVEVAGGTTLRALIAFLAARGLALTNIGTLADQTVAGALATGNHGTGAGLGALATQVRSLRLVTADGRVREVTPADPETFRAALTSLGALGVVTSVTFETVPRFALRVWHETVSVDALLGGLDEIATSARHVSVNWLPWRDRVSVRRMEPSHRTPARTGALRSWAITLDEVRCGLTSVGSGLWPDAPTASARIPMPLLSGEPQVLESHHAFCFPQPVRFSALEHALPVEHLAEGAERVGRLLRAAGLWSPYSMLLRFGAGDDALLSPAHGRATGYLNVTVPRTTAFAEVHRQMEPVLRELGGRPHWGKAHTATSLDLAPLYPAWEDFARVRKSLDPAGTFGSAYLDRVLGS